MRELYSDITTSFTYQCSTHLHEKSTIPFINIDALREDIYDYTRMKTPIAFARDALFRERIVIVFTGFTLFALVVFTATSSRAIAQTSVWKYTFNSSGTLMEAGNVLDSTSPYYWLNSGGKFVIKDGIGMTLQGSLPSSDATRLLYAKMNPLDTENGYKPQNTLRLITRNSWKDVEESLKFKIIKTNLTDTPNRDSYSGVFVFGRYSDQYNLYYVGLRHDGQAVIKKKIQGTYHTLAEKQVYGDEANYNRLTNPNLLPSGEWMGLRATFENLADGSVRVKMYIDRNNTGAWELVTTAIDAGVGGAPLTHEGKAGVRTDFMDVHVDDFTLRPLY